MQQIWKFPVTPGQTTRVLMPSGAELLNVQTQFDTGVLWAIVEPENKNEFRYFELYGTGHPMINLDKTKERNYVNTFQLENGSLVFHLFELKTKKQ